VIAAIVLAAGASRRLGQPKQLVALAGEALLRRAVRMALEAGCGPVIPVLPREHGRFLAVLEGLAVDDMALVAKHSQELALLSHAANWQVMQTEDYLQHSLEFRRAANAVTKAAREMKLDGATLAYVSMTMNCVKCHKYVRGIRMADASK